MTKYGLCESSCHRRISRACAAVRLVCFTSIIRMLFNYAIDKPLSIRYRQFVALGITKTSVVHEQKCRLKEDLSILRPQAKESLPPRAGAVPPHDHNSYIQSKSASKQ